MRRFCVQHLKQKGLFWMHSWNFLLCLLLISAASQTRSFAGVFMLIEDGKYTLDFTAAKAACLDLNVTMATTAQMERALQHGLETCKYVENGGFIDLIIILKQEINTCFFGQVWLDS
uniref:Link domain-containing protein n=1 Tax=Gouania willdenowi TaxID=441366 RepID=A0A8C5E3F7_GOUWI